MQTWDALRARRNVRTFAAQPIGTAGATRRVVVGVYIRRATPKVISGVTIGGITATQDADKIEALDLNEVAFYSAVVPTGTTADVVVTVTGTGAVRCFIDVWSLDHGAPVAVAYSAESEPGSFTIATQVGDFVVAAVGAQASGATTWTGATERYDTLGTGTSRHTAADTVAVGASTVIDFDFVGTLTNTIAGAAVAYR